MRYENEAGEPLDEKDIDLNLGWVEERRDPVEHPAVEPVPAQGHWQDVMEDGQVIGQTWVVDVPAVEGSAAWTGYETVGVYHPYSSEQLESNAKAKADADRVSALAVQAPVAVMMLVQSQAATLSDEAAAELPAMFDEWTVGSEYRTGDIVRYKGGLWRALQDSTAQDIYPPDGFTAGWKRIGEPDESGVFPYQQPLGATDAYMTGDKVSYNGAYYESIIDYNVWSPDAYPRGWKRINADGTDYTDTGDAGDTGEAGGETATAPEFVQPSGAQDAYGKGDRVTYGGKVYESVIDGNVWSPDAYPAGWKLVG